MNLGVLLFQLENQISFLIKLLNKKYSLEYGTDTVEIHKDAIENDDNILLIDDVLATGGTACAAIDLLENFNCNLLECLFLLELTFLDGVNKILEKRKKSFSLLKV